MDSTERVATESGVEPKALAVLAYLAWWVTGLAVLALERRDPYVRFHAWQSVIGLGALWAAGLVCYLTAFLVLSVSAAAFTAMLWTAAALWTVGLTAWAVCLFKAWIGERWKLPIAGTVAERYSTGDRH